MSELEDALGATLGEVAAAAPDGVGLAEAARHRMRRRRRRRAGLLGAAVVVVVAGLVATVLSPIGRDDPAQVAHDPEPTATGTAATGWTVVQEQSVIFDLPPGWRRYECVEPEWTQVIHGPGDPCGWDGAGIAVYGGATFDPSMGPGVVVEDERDSTWGAYVDAGQEVLYVQAFEEVLVRRVLASARLEGQPAVVATRWERHSRGVISYEVPRWWGLGAAGPLDDYSVCVELDPDLGHPPPKQIDRDHFELQQAFGSFAVTVTAPTQAVAELVMATVTVHPTVSRMDECSPEAFDR